MAEMDLRNARRAAVRNTQRAVLVYAREPSIDSELAVARACARLRMIDEWRVRRTDRTHPV